MILFVLRLYCLLQLSGRNPAGASLIRRIPGAHAAHAALVDAVPKVRKFAYSLTGNLADADDLLQSTVERALTRGAPQEEREALLKWMFTVCRNLWIDEVRARKVRGSDDPHPPEVDAQSIDGEAELQGVLALGELQSAMLQLGAEQRAVLDLVGVEGFSYREAAEVLGVPVGTVMSRLARARGTLAEALARGNRSAP
jgi:RNA polymerase sigma factor (sigma-70 family)